MKYRCQTCGHKDILEAFLSESDIETDLESYDDIIMATCPSCGDEYTSHCLEEA